MVKVVKFGGSSLASAEQFAKVGQIIRSDKERKPESIEGIYSDPDCQRHRRRDYQIFLRHKTALAGHGTEIPVGLQLVIGPFGGDD